jgi:single-stranded-DNA-specific exonuclease
MNSALVTQAQNIAHYLKKYGFIRIISHNDADGITAAGIMSLALSRSNIPFQTTIVSHLGQDIIDRINARMNRDDEAVLFCDMGSGQPELVNQVKDEVLVIDHHQIVGDHESHIQINPHNADVDGSNMLSASGTAFFVACAMGDNADMAGLALTGAIGDKQKMEGPNGDILLEAKKAGVVSIKTGLKVPDGAVEEVLLTLTEPYIDTAGDKAATKKFVDELGISGQKIQNMNVEELTKLASAIALKIAKRSEPSAVQSIVGDVLILNNEIVPNIYTFEWMINCCGKMEQPAIGLSLCLRDKSMLDEAARLSSGYQQSLVENIRSAQTLITEMNHIRYIALEDFTGTGLIASTLIRYVCPDKPLITLNKVEDMIRVSARGTPRLVQKGLDLAAVMREASSVVGGQGGGHNIASGAGIPLGTEKSFLTSVDSITGGQIT